MAYDVIIVGGGASGLAAAAFLGRGAAACGKPCRVLLLERASRVGRKLLATGNGTCNLTNIHAAADRYHGGKTVAETALKALTPTETVAFFTAIGVDCRIREDGRVYPLSEQAGAVLDALRLEAAARGVELRCDAAVKRLCPLTDGWRVETETEAFTARRVLVCPGGAASPSLGGGTDGYRLLTDLGLTKTPLFPSIVQLRTATDFVRAVKGIRVDAAVSLWLDGRCLAAETGEVLFTDYGLSGPAVMQISRHAADWERRRQGELVAVLDLLPDWESDRLIARLTERGCLPGRTMEDLLTGLVHKRVGQTVLRVAQVLPLTRSADSLTQDEAVRIAGVLRGWRIPVTGTQGFGGAQVTAGGIEAGQLDPATMMFRRFPGLYAAGEVLDVDGDCGGFNLQFAWSSAYAAAQAMLTDQ